MLDWLPKSARTVLLGIASAIVLVLVVGRQMVEQGSDPTPVAESTPVTTNTPYPQPVQSIGVENAERVTQLTRWGTGSWQVAFSPDGRLLAVATGIGLYLYDIPALSEVRFIAADAALVSVAFSPDGRQLASGSWDTTVRLWDVETGQPVRTLAGHTWWMWSVAFAPDGRLLASGAGDGTICLWDVETGQPVRTLAGHTFLVSGVAFAPNGRLLASGSWDGTIRLWGVAP